MLLSVAQYRSPRIRKVIFSPGALMVITDSRVIEASLRRKLMTRDDLVERLRAKGIAGIEDVRVAYIKSGGDISALTDRESSWHQVCRASAAEEEAKAG